MTFDLSEPTTSTHGSVSINRRNAAVTSMQNVFGEMKKNPAEFEYCKNFISLDDFLENRESDDHVDAYLEQ